MAGKVDYRTIKTYFVASTGYIEDMEASNTSSIYGTMEIPMDVELKEEQLIISQVFAN